MVMSGIYYHITWHPDDCPSIKRYMCVGGVLAKRDKTFYTLVPKFSIHLFENFEIESLFTRFGTKLVKNFSILQTIFIK